MHDYFVDDDNPGTRRHWKNQQETKIFFNTLIFKDKMKRANNTDVTYTEISRALKLL